ncbi:quinoprotein relay system zinc metallohydrolase 1 [Sphingomonas crocodyli]|uniref:Quinoprotein relay system zinc metallohydrolase 1 n=1 Tax=Sphingomonas crocodyli TaxID=1979270 RepID=A0A437M5X0_9SPHN|nr:quinoprotein relay system zinc metallohydrolase 1 [Sphingomonas crocodyli]RVT93029.1 quinoprotein relay system zinc metallohydrolase 1 [Sphingomonas crocodyli]
MIGRRSFIAGLGLIACIARAQDFDYKIEPVSIGDGIWIVRGADAPIDRNNGGAIANLTIIATPVGAVLIDCGPSLRYGALRKMIEALTGKAVVRIYITHVHPDHLYGDGAFDIDMIAATQAQIEDFTAEAKRFNDGMYRLLGDWMRGTEAVIPRHVLTGEVEDFGGRRIRLLPLAGHSAADLALLDEASGTLIAGDLVFHNRAPSTPNADLAKWRASLDTLKALKHRQVVPGHGPFDRSPAAAIDQTRDWIDWIEATIDQAVRDGLGPVEAGNLPLPPRFAAMAAARYELQRSVSHFYAAAEERLVARIDRKK